MKPLPLVLLLLLAFLPARAESGLANRLVGHPSPYLAMHGDDPVAWQPWSPQALALARAENKPILLSIGYFSCHWCHVMQRESFRNPAIAALINAHFIPVKVDREIDTALDAAMIAFARKLIGAAGWPLNVFLTPEGDPFFAVIYQVPDDFAATLRRVDGAWQADPAAIRQAARREADDAAMTGKPHPLTPGRARESRDRFIAAVLALGDPLRGGLGGASKFPQAPRLLALLRLLERQGHPELRAFLVLTLEEMQHGGLRDHLRGGFFRYTTDPDWRIPHFEKMLYDQAQLARVYLLAGQLFERPDFTTTGFETLDFLLTHMADEKTGAFVTALSAVDAKHREGGDYLWRKEDLPPLEEAERNLLARTWGLDQVADFDAGYLPMQRIPLDEANRARLEGIHKRLGRLRSVAPPRDDKLLASLNGLALQALAQAAGQHPRYREAADRLARFLLDRIEPDGSLGKGQRAGMALGPGELEDYAQAALGLLAHGRLTGQPATSARRLLIQAWRKFHDGKGFRLGTWGGTLATVADEALPSAPAALIEASLASGDKALAARARQALAAAPLPEATRIIDHASLVALMESASARR